MKFMKLQLLIIALVGFVGSSAFAALSYDVSVDTTSLSGTSGYLYFQYVPINAVESTAMVFNFATTGTLSASPSPAGTLGGSTGTLTTGTGAVTFDTANNATDYNHGIQFGTNLNFSLLLNAPVPGAPAGGVSTFSLGLFADEAGLTPLLNTTGVNGSVPGTLFMVNLFNDGTASTQVLTPQATVVPIPAAIWLLGSGLVGLVGIRRRSRA